MAVLQYNEEAIVDLDKLYFYWAFEREKPDYADRLLTGLRGAVEALTDFPLMGVVREEWRAGLRALIHDRYVILYTYLEQEDAVLVENILDGRQDIEGRFKE